MMGLNLTKCNVSEFLEQYRNKNTRTQHRAHLKHYFTYICPELESVSNDEIETKLDALSLHYFKYERDIRKDLVKYTNTIQKYAPKTRSLKLSTLFRFLEDNGLDVLKTLRRNLIGQEINAISEARALKKNIKSFLLAQVNCTLFLALSLHGLWELVPMLRMS
jgi:hypothetical protein